VSIDDIDHLNGWVDVVSFVVGIVQEVVAMMVVRSYHSMNGLRHQGKISTRVLSR